MKKLEIFLSALLVPLDYLALVLAALSAYALRFAPWVRELRPVIFALTLREYLIASLWVAVGFIIIFAISGLYVMKPKRRLPEEFSKIFLACSTATMAVILIFFFSRELFSSRFIIIASWLFSIIYVSFTHAVIKLIQRYLYKKGKGLRKVVLIGQDKTAQVLSQTIKRRKSYGYQLVAHFPFLDQAVFKKIFELLPQEKFDEIILSDFDLPRKDILELIKIAENNHLDFKHSADVLGAQAARVELQMIGSVPIVSIKKTLLEGWGRVIKRLFDLIVSLLLLTFLLPVFLIIILAIKLDSPGPAIVGLKRVGIKGRLFVLYKFRSMIVGAENLKEKLLPFNERGDGPLFKLAKDPRVTRFGTVLRKYSLDELPQLINVLKGEMSLVGPRPHEPQEVEKYQLHHKRLLTIKPGMTGLAQVSGRSDLTFEEEVKLDRFYIEQWSLKLDIVILLKTPLIVLTRPAV